MANKLYEVEDVRRIANSIRANAPNKVGRRDFSLSEMPSGIDDVYMEGYENGLDLGYNYGFADGDTNGYGNGYIDGYDDGYEVGFEAGSAGGVVDPTTVWEIIDVPSFGTLSTTQIDVLFTSAAIEFVGIYSRISGGAATKGIYYCKSDGTSIQVYSLANGWDVAAYRTITITETITNETLLSWLEENATLISGGGSGELHHLLYEQIQSKRVNYISDYSYCYPIDIYGSSIYYDMAFDDYVEKEISSPSSNPLTYSVDNYSNYYLYLYVRATDTANDEGYVAEIVVPPYWNNSVDFVSQISMGNPVNWKVEIIGARFTINEL